MKVSGKQIGVARLRILIAACEAGSVSELATLKRVLGIKGNQETVLAEARAMLANVANW